jgi:hypothetical protein
MLSSLEVDDERINTVFTWCQKSFSNVGHKLQFPKGTDPRKTYKWQHVKKLAYKLAEWEFDDDTSRTFIDQVAQHARDNKLLRKGLSAFFQSNILEVCNERLEQSQKRSDSALTSLSRTHDFLVRESNGRPIRFCLVDRADPNAFFNLVTWFETGKITTTYLAVSEECRKALIRIKKTDPDQRELLPSTLNLFAKFKQCSCNLDFSNQAQKILGKDWRSNCVNY